MTHILQILSLALLVLLASACAGPSISHEPDVSDMPRSAQADQVKTAVIQVLIEGGYAFDKKDDENQRNGYRGEISDPSDGVGSSAS